MPSAASWASTEPSAFETIAVATPVAAMARNASGDPGMTRVHTPPVVNSDSSTSATSSTWSPAPSACA